LGFATQTFEAFWLDELCDFYVEGSKKVLYGDDKKAKAVT
jgi:valyl-tRNA synthetase